MENSVTDINCTTSKTNALKLFEKQLKLEDHFYAKFLFDGRSAVDIINWEFFYKLTQTKFKFNTAQNKRENYNF